jgi:predicted protein tyrosine phosphatase
MTTFKSVEFISRHEAVQRKPQPSTIVISINEVNAAPAALQEGWQAVHVVHYKPTRFLDEPNGFTRQMAKGIVDFVAEHENTADRILVHCYAGESRSAAVALALDEKYSLGLDQETCELAHAMTLDFLFDIVLRDL